MPVISNCGCVECLGSNVVTKVGGRVHGFKKDGTKIPLKFGNIYYQDEIIGTTTFSGSFLIDVPEEASEPLIVEFEDSYFGIFLSSMKTLRYLEGATTHQEVILPLKPEPVVFQANDEVKVELGGNEDDSVATVLMTDNKFTKIDGTAYEGEVKMYMNYIDPRYIDSLLSAPVDFDYLGEDGEVQSLITYGAISVAIEDEDGNALSMDGNLTWAQEAETFGIEENDEGTPEAYLWYLDHVTGRWIEIGQMAYQEHSDIRKRSSHRVVIGDVNIAQLPTTETRTRVLNIDKPGDKPCPSGYYRRGRTSCQRTEWYSVTKSDLCYVRVGAYSAYTFQNPLRSAVVTVATKPLNSDTYQGFQRGTTRRNGFVCIATYCNTKPVIFVEFANEKLYAAENHNLPTGYQFQNIEELRKVEFEARDWGTINSRHGPVYIHRNINRCNSASASNFHFMFAPLAPPPSRGYTRNRRNVRFHPLNWYPDPLTSTTRRACFMKVKIRVSFYLNQLMCILIIQDYII